MQFRLGMNELCLDHARIQSCLLLLNAVLIGNELPLPQHMDLACDIGCHPWSAYNLLLTLLLLSFNAFVQKVQPCNPTLPTTCS